MWLTAALLVPLLAAVLYALWPETVTAPPPLPPAGEGRGEGLTQPPPPSRETAESEVALNKPPASPQTRVAPTPVREQAVAPPTTAPAPSPSPDSAPDEAAPTDAAAAKALPHTLDRDGIRSAIRETLPEMRDCYESWLQQNPELGGSLSLSFQIVAADGGGVVQNIAILDGGIGHRAFEGCVANVFSGLEFDEPQGQPMNVTYPLVFSNNAAP